MITLRPYQVEAADAVMAAKARGVTRPLVGLPTGTGKTIVFADLIRRRGGRALVLAHRDELITQAVDKIRMVWPTARPGIVKAERDETDALVVVASVQTVSRRARLARLAPTFGTVVVDEAHHATADSYARVLTHVGAMDEGGPLTIGVTATPERGDGKPLGDVWQEIVYQTPVLDMIRAGYLCDLRGIQVQIAADLDAVHVRGGDLAAGELDDELQAADAPTHVVEAWLRHAADRRATLIFTATVRLAHGMAEAFQARGIPAEAVDGTTPLDDRRAMLQRLSRGETRVMANCAVLTEGFDLPAIDCIVMARPTQSRPSYIQMVGRGTRTLPGKKDCLVLDLVGNATRHSIQTIATLAGSEAGRIRPTDGESLLEAVARAEQGQAELAAQGELVSRTVDLFGRRSFAWVAGDTQRYVLSVGDGVIMLDSPDLERWSVIHATRSGPRRVLADDLDLGYAQGTAEDLARGMGAGALVARGARWRHDPATDRQRDALRRWKVPVPPGITKGEASDLLAAAVARVA